MERFRKNGAIGALLDEYERAILELEKVISTTTLNELKTVVDDETKDPDCKSIQTILTHVIRSGYCYVIEIRKSKGEDIEFVERIKLDTVKEYQNELSNMFKYNEQLFDDYPNLKLEEMDNQKKIVVKWGQIYDVEQLFEHAIVHVLRHRRQIERFLTKLRKEIEND